MFKRTEVSVSLAVAFGGALAVAAMPGMAQQPAEQKLDRVEITGSSIKRIEAETAAPIQVLKREDIERSGATSVEQIMRTVSSMVSSNSTAAASAAGATTGGISTISMRGLTAERTLILVNGKRTAPYGSPSSSVAVDVDSIPVAAIERVEILKDGASAIYGSDAIAGVVNFILRKDVAGVELNVGYGAATQDGKGDVSKASIVAGFGDIGADKFNVLVIGNYQKDGALFGRDRDFASTSIRLDKDNFNGSSRSDPANINFATGALDVDGNPVRVTRNPNVNRATGSISCAPNGAYVPDINPNTCQFDTAPFVGLLPATERMGLQASGRFSASSDLELYTDASWGRKEVRTVIQPSPIDAAFGIPFTMTTANPFYPTAFVQSQTVDGSTPNLAVRYRPFIIGNRDLTDTATSTRLVLGAKGTVRDWDYDANLLRTTSEVTEKLNGGFFRANNDATGPGIVPLLAGQVLNSSGAPLWVNPFGTNTAEVIAAAKATNFVGEAFSTKTNLSGIQAKASKELMELPGGGLGVALGGEFRREGYILDSSPALGTGNISGFGGNFVSIDTSRSVKGFFGEIVAPVLKGLEINAAARRDGYAGTTNPLDASVATSSLAALASSPSGDPMPAAVINQIAADATGDAPSFSKTTGKLGLRYQANSALLLRGTLSSGFRAPALLDLYGPVQAGVSAVQNDPQNCRGTNVGNPDFCATQFNIYSGGNSKLKPETSTSLTYGFIIEPASGFSIGIDYFRTKVDNLIQVLSSSFILEHESQYQNRVTRGPSGEIVAIDQRLENLGRTQISGADFDVRFNTTTEYGRIGVSWSATHMNRWQTQNPDGSFEDGIGTTSSAVTGFIPRLRHTTNLTWGLGPWLVAGTYNWQSGATDVCGNLLQDDFGNCPEGSNPHVGPYETIDAQIQYSGIKNLSLAIGARNLLDRDPPYVNGTGGAFQSGYDPTYVDPRGRFVYFNVKYKFF